MNYDEIIFTLNQNDFQINIKAIDFFMKKNNLSANQFCKNCGITKQEFTKIQNQNFTFSYESIVKISIYTKINIKHLIPNAFPPTIQTVFKIWKF